MQSVVRRSIGADPRSISAPWILTPAIGWLSRKGLSRDFWKFFAAAFCFDFGIAMFLFLYNLFLLDFGFAEKAIGLIASAMTIGGVVGTIPVGILARSVGLHRLLFAAFISVPILFACRAFLVWLPAQIALSFLSGVCLALWTVSFSPAAAKLTDESNRAFAFSLLFSVGIGTGALGGMIGGYLPGWLQAMGASIHAADAKRFVLLLACLIAALAAWPISRLWLQTEPSGKRSARRFNPFLLRFLPSVALWSVVIGSFTPFASVYLARQVRISLPQVGLAFSASQLAQVVAVLIAPAIFRRFGMIAGIMYTQLATAAALIALGSVRGVGLCVTVYLIFTAAQWMSSPGLYSFLMSSVQEDERSGASAACIFVTSLSQAFASALAGYGYASFGYRLMLPLVGAIAIAAAFVLRLLLGPSDRPAQLQNKEMTTSIPCHDN